VAQASDEDRQDRTPLIERLAPSSAPSLPVLRVVAGGDVLRFALVQRDGAVEIGRDEGCDLRVDDESVSRRHARVERSGDEYFVEDRGSRNGTHVNGRRIRRERLRPGDRLEVGTLPLRFDLVTLEELAHLRGVVDRLEASDRDPLTGLLTRAYLDARLPAQLEQAERKGRPLSAVFMDIDHFKSVNDRFGHAAGDDVLRQASRLLVFTARGRESCVRYGGEELLLVAEDADEAQARSAAERVRAAIESHDWSRVHQALAVTLSCGVAQHRRGESVRELLERADRALYQAKRSGRNRVVVASSLETGPPP
jgi:diguanylate cyclase (GGDEF)-like protein